MKITHKKITASNYVPDMTQQYPEGQYDISDGYEDRRSYLYDDDFGMAMDVGQAILGVLDDPDDYCNDIFVYDTIDYYAQPDTLDGIPDSVSHTVVDHMSRDEESGALYIWTPRARK